MENGTRDVNAEFKASKVQQMAAAENKREWLNAELKAGNLRSMGKAADGVSDRYRVLTGWDKGEVFTVNLDAIASAAEQISGQHGLDRKADGTVAAYFKDTPAWWDLDGTNVIKGGYSSVDAVLKSAGLDWDTVLTPQQGINPVTGEIDTFMEDYMEGGEIKSRPVGFHTRRGDTGQILGAVGKIYTPITNRQAFSFLDELFGDELMICESAGSFRNGAKVFITAELPDHLIVDPNGIADHIRQFLAITNTHDGSGQFTAMVTPWRIECGNTERFAVRDAVTKWAVRHTKNAMSKVETAARTLGLTTQYYAAWCEEETALVQTPFSANQIDALINEVWGELDADATKAATTRDAKRRDAVHDVFAFESGRVGSNAYAAERAVTAYMDHFAELRPRGVLRGNRLAAAGLSVMEGTADETKNRAHKALMTLVRR